MRRPLALAALALSLALSTAACGGDEDSDLPRVGSTPSASPTPSATPSWSATAQPERPQDEQSEEGARAFTEFVADTVLYVMATGDAPALSSIANLSSCEQCRVWDDNFTSGKIVERTIGTGPATYALADSPTVTEDVFYKVPLTMDIPPGRTVNKNSGDRKKIGAAKDLPFTADIKWEDDQWLLMRYEMG